MSNTTDGVIESTYTGVHNGKNPVGFNVSTSSAFNLSSTVGECKHPTDILREYNFDDPDVFLCLMFVFFGLFYCILGYRFFRGSMFLIGFVFGCWIVRAVCAEDVICPAYAKIGLFLGVGLTVGLLTMLVRYVGLFLIGCYTGVLMCFAFVAVSNYLSYRITSIWFNMIYLVICLIFPVATIYWKKGLTIFGTSACGAAILTGTLDYFMEKLLMLKWIWEKLTFQNSVQPCEMSYYILLTWPIFVFIGVAVQWIFTGKGIHHINGFEKQRRHSNHNSRTRNRARDLSAENSQKKYRYLYQVRTAHGDVISQNYVQALQRKVMPDMMTTMGESSTLQSDATHLTTLPVDQTMTQLSDSKTNTVDSEGSVRYDINRYQDLSSRESVQSNITNQYYQ